MWVDRHNILVSSAGQQLLLYAVCPFAEFGNAGLFSGARVLSMVQQQSSEGQRLRIFNNRWGARVRGRQQLCDSHANFGQMQRGQVR